MVRVLSTPRHLPARAKLLNPIATIEDLPHDAPWWATESAMCALGTTRAIMRSPSRRLFAKLAGHALACSRRWGGCAISVSAYPHQERARIRDRPPRFPSLAILRPGCLGGKRSGAGPLERIVGARLRDVLRYCLLALRLALHRALRPCWSRQR
jgi:hypothetical protein